MAKYRLVDRSFASKGHAKNYISGILDGAPLESPLRKEVILRIIAWLSDVHYDWDRKRGPGIKTIYVKQNLSNARGLWLKRVDGSEVDVSYIPYKNKRLRTMRAFRCTVMDQVKEFRDSVEWPTECPITGKMLNEKDAHIHHAWPYPFSRIVETFLGERGIDIEKVATRSAIGETTRWLVDKDLEREFEAYHKKHAVLQAVDAEWNIRAGNNNMEGMT